MSMKQLIGGIIIYMLSIFMAFVIAGSTAEREKQQWQEEYSRRALAALEIEAELTRISEKSLQVAKEAKNTLNECTAFLLEIENDLRAQALHDTGD